MRKELMTLAAIAFCVAAPTAVPQDQGTDLPLPRWGEEVDGPFVQAAKRCRELDVALTTVAMRQSAAPDNAASVQELHQAARNLEEQCAELLDGHPSTAGHKALYLWSRNVTDKAINLLLVQDLAPLLGATFPRYSSEAQLGLRRPIAVHIDAARGRAARSGEHLAMLTEDTAMYGQ